MSPISAKHKPVKHTKSHVPIVNVFDEEDSKTEALQPARRPVVVEIEDAGPDEEPLQSPTAPMAAPAAPVHHAHRVPEMYTPEIPETQSAAAPNGGPSLPSFFAEDLQPNVVPVYSEPADTPLNTIEATMPQAVVGEIHQEAQRGNGKKIVGIVLMILALIVLAIGGLVLYAKNLFAPVALPTPTPTPEATMHPTPTLSPTPAASSSATASASAELKKKIKVDVLNGTKTVGLAAKEAAILKTAGYVMGTVGNGKPENAGTIIVPPAYRALANDIVSLLKDFTFTVTENAKFTSIQVTLGESK
ncbi:MAG: LytR C-terminal domain-containing protein [Candidatus Woesebacteria bacterium]